MHKYFQFLTNLSKLECEIQNFIKTYKRKRFSSILFY